MTATAQADTPYFSQNRDMTDLAYQLGWDAARAGNVFDQPYQKQTLKDAFLRGFEAAV